MFTPPKRLTQETDFLFTYATALSCKAFQSNVGSLFITDLCQSLESYASKLPLDHILESVSQKQAMIEPHHVKKSDGTQTKEKTRQSPNFYSSLRGPVFFSNDARKQYEEGILSTRQTE